MARKAKKKWNHIEGKVSFRLFTHTLSAKNWPVHLCRTNCTIPPLPFPMTLMVSTSAKLIWLSVGWIGGGWTKKKKKRKNFLHLRKRFLTERRNRTKAKCLSIYVKKSHSIEVDQQGNTVKCQNFLIKEQREQKENAFHL